MLRFSLTVRVEKILRPSGAWETPMKTISCAGMPWIDLPPMKTSPFRGRSSPLTVRKVVVLPAPLAPINATISPGATESEMPFSACTWP